MAFFTVDSLRSSLGHDGFEQLKNGAVDKGAAFLSGQITTSMSKAMSGEKTVSLINVAALGAGIGGVTTSLVQDPSVLGELATNIIAVAMDTATKESTKIVGKITAKAVQLPLSMPGKITQYTKDAFEANKKTFGEILKEVMIEQESQAEEKNEKQDKKSDENTKQNTEEDLNETKDSVAESLNKLKETLSKVSDYITEGPDYVAKELDKQIIYFVSKVDKEVNQRIATIEKRVDDDCKAKGEERGLRMAEKYNDTLREQAKKQLAGQKTAIAKAKTLAFKAKQAAALQVMSMTGINIPI